MVRMARRWRPKALCLGSLKIHLYNMSAKGRLDGEPCEEVALNGFIIIIRYKCFLVRTAPGW